MAKTTMQNIADALNISKNAVSLAINGKPGISETLRVKIIDKAKELDYNGLQKAKMRKKNILLIIDDQLASNDEFFFPLISGILSYSTQVGYNTMLVSVSEEMQEDCVIPSAYYEVDAAGVILLGRISRKYLEHFVGENIPCVMMLLHHYGVSVDYVMSANIDGAYMTTSYAISCGHRKLGYVADVSTYSSFRERLQGYRCALADAGIALDRRYELLLTSAAGAPKQADAEKAAEEILRMEDPPTVWICGNDDIALMLMDAFAERGVSIPNDLSITGFDGVRMAYLTHPRLCTYDVRRDELGRRAIDLLIHRIQSDDFRPAVVESVTGKLVKGETVKVLL